MTDVCCSGGGSGSRTQPDRAYVGLGANLGDRAETIASAVELLRGRREIDVVAVSTLRETDPVGFEQQPPFLNGACSLDTTLSARQLLDELLAVESELGRTRLGARWGPRTIDLDLLLFGDQEIEEPGLTVPHPRLHERAFALEPLLELDADLALPNGRSMKNLLAAIK